MQGNELVAIARRIPFDPEALEDGTAMECRNHCGWLCKVEGILPTVIAEGATLLCQECATIISVRHPDAFTRIDSWP